MSIRLSPFPLCRHTKTDGRRCKAPALPTSAFCYHHRRLRGSRPNTTARARARTLQLPPIVDHGSILHACNLVLGGLASGRLDNRTAGQMIHLIQLTGSRLPENSIE